MKTLYLECNMGAAGDMLMSALSELLENQDAFIERLNKLNIPSVTFEKKTAVKCGITGTHIDVSVNGTHEDEHMHEHHHHHHTGMHEIEHIIGGLDISEKVRNDVLAIYRLIAEAESQAHGCSADEIHFHEVGTMDAIADITGVCILMDEIGADKVVVSPVHVGSGQVKCAHGILPVPAPATAYILKDVPIYGGAVAGELCTPTGAALLKYFADKFGSMPIMRVAKTGYGMGTKDFETANCLRAMLGEESEGTPRITELCCNIDDMTGEEIGFAVDTLFREGAIDVFTTAVNMKKNRPGIMLTCLCKETDSEKFARLIFLHTSTIGIRSNICERYVLERKTETVQTKYGEVRIKVSEGYGVRKAKAEYDDIERIARECSISIAEVKKEIGSL